MGGLKYEITLKVILPDEKVEKKKLKVNGEDEILSKVMGSLGRMKIINAPQELKDRAAELNLPLGFIFEDE